MFMSTDQTVVVVTGASHGLGEAFVQAYRERGWRAVGNSRSIAACNDADYVTVPGNIGEPAVAGAWWRPRWSGSAASTR